ncbi:MULTISPECIES: sensor histidine kinase [unclassified Bradyrhizobium]|uniref:sensor histidine kinase n=1 Tax=unclassified Bradyrhizobium TaxID=2631580 RepID=UPI001BA7810E|nr:MULTISPECIES: histidine kinase [unclassified Bradyrhizobium]MBR1204251.1 histidine kinase [Bradyrhizobium sp. AUGA SZCCT0124]MBR1309863.1 histidine kinase [Bradyrhizobium sp. AUGA SZCCT0051]MBR1340004.1 histidine kinase [Bradyrhizobium sp. AUGA SZCCT0105]MBR1354611.1 histidine kinase [Bradyrhizobium sp. AUGA SZCCT0045]
MRLVLQLVARLLVIVALCLAAATFWATIDAYRSVDRATSASAERVSQALEALYWRELLLRSSRMREQLLPAPDWRTIETMGLIAPGICVQFEPAGAFEKPLCGQSKGIGKAPPRWFAATVQTVLGGHATVERPISARTATAGTVRAVSDPDAAIALAWQHILDNIHVALLMALAIALLASLAIAHTLAPAHSIVSALRRMAEGEYRTPLPRVRSMDLAMIGRAVGDLGDRLAQAEEERTMLTRRLLEIRSDERRALARELHDEFGQNLTAILAFATTIEASAGDKYAAGTEIAQDARMISQATRRIIACLRDTLNRLRHPPAEELGLEASLVDLVDSWRSRSTQPMIQLDLQGDLADISGTVAATAYRIAQECLTNALRHSAAREIVLRIERRTGAENALLVRVEDDGGGDAAKVAQSAGFGLTGVSERVAALGGSLSIATARRGLSVAATIPLAA